MVSLTEVQSSNSLIPSVLPSGLVAVFVGATSGIGETTLKQFAKYTRQPHVYFIGRSQEAGDRITAECKALNKEGEYAFIKADVSLIKVVDDICRDIKSKEQSINLLFQCQGTMVPHTSRSIIPRNFQICEKTMCKICISELTCPQRVQKASTSP